MRTKRNREIENIYYNASMYCDNPEEILSSFELMDAQMGAESYEPDFDEKLEADLEIVDSEEDPMTDLQQWQRNNFEEYYPRLLKTTSRKEVYDLNEEVKAKDIECKPDYFFSAQDSKTWRAAVNARFNALPKAGPTEEQKQRFATFYKKLEEVKTVQEHIALRTEVINLGRELQEKEEYVFCKTDADTWWAKSNEIKESNCLASNLFPKEGEKVTHFSDLVANAKGNKRKLEEIRSMLYHSKDISVNGKKPIYLVINDEIKSISSSEEVQTPIQEAA